MFHDQFLIENVLSIVSKQTRVSIYDFAFRRYFDCRSPYEYSSRLPGVARVGAIGDFDDLYELCLERGVQLVHTREDHERCSFLPNWYPLIEALTPRSRWYDQTPTLIEVEQDFELPVFLKGERQTSKHQAALSIIRSREDFESAIETYRTDPMLRWQKIVVRELLGLRKVHGSSVGKIPASFEFRTFWWRGDLVGAGRYWFEAPDYSWNDFERAEALSVAKNAVEALQCAFLVVDVAQTVEGEWVVIEVNDGMESGYAGASPFLIWQNILDVERSNAEQ